MPIFIIRHGETEWNVQGKKQGRGDSPLTDKGEQQAHSYAECLRSMAEPINRVLISPLGRAQSTGRIVASALEIAEQNIATVDALVELDYGEWQGLTDADIDKRFPGEREKRMSRHWTYQIPQGESYAMLWDRLSDWWDEQELENSLIVAHEVVNRVILGLYQQLETSETLALSHPHGIVRRLHEGAVKTITVSSAES